jgi:predicted 2-oxoglutarate/Fe(II)-dependent dioxygenase YbiX
VRTEHLGDRILTIKGLFTPGECAALVALAEGIGFGAAPITTGHGFVMAPDVRNNTRVILDDPERARVLWQRMSTFAPTRRGREAVGLNERFRFYRYAPGEFFHWHHDGAFHRNEHEQSLLTAMVYLNGDFEGGSTDFDFHEESITIIPEPGLVLLFDHGIRHQGAAVKRGRKYVLRTDVMYRVQRSI